ncbi:hypothetical protein [Pleomorphomonas sp. NRK KF1]|uniref:hypothetical protein n=1 Tax=Pleomorphomonas sp. NRK KF1 TaxID=2943000 RepID=UPI0020436A09|nr:hypothetical protein [Pleomorphomonas sp. NRK KF1]MCM5554610.1 hypothetical protein [Pleomorphomonas sp. NRK KF1]
MGVLFGAMTTESRLAALYDFSTNIVAPAFRFNRHLPASDSLGPEMLVGLLQFRAAKAQKP